MSKMFLDLLLKTACLINSGIDFFRDCFQFPAVIGLKNNNKLISAVSADETFANAYVLEDCSHLL